MIQQILLPADIQLTHHIIQQHCRRLMGERLRYIQNLEPEAREIYRGISKNREQMGLRMVMTGISQENTKTNYAEAMMETLQKCRRDDLGAGFTTAV